MYLLACVTSSLVFDPNTAQGCIWPTFWKSEQKVWREETNRRVLRFRWSGGVGRTTHWSVQWTPNWLCPLRTAFCRTTRLATVAKDKDIALHCHDSVGSLKTERALGARATEQILARSSSSTGEGQAFRLRTGDNRQSNNADVGAVYAVVVARRPVEGANGRMNSSAPLST
jgi:hypothetical protein